MFVRDRKVIVQAGDKRAIAPAVRSVVSAGGRELGRLEVSITDARAYASRARRLTTLQLVVFNGGKVLATTLPVASASKLPLGRGAKATLGGVEYRVQNFRGDNPFHGQDVRVFTLGSIAAATESVDSGDRTFASAILLGFFLLAIACAVLVSRTLQQQIAEFLTAARRLAGGDFSAQVPTVGRDEFAELGEEFNKMSRELERRLVELSQERGRVQDSMRRLGEAVAANLDRDALLELVVQTAVDGVGADAGRACVRSNGGEKLQERSRVGDMNGIEAAVASVEAEAMASGSARETTIGAATAIAQPLRRADGGDDVIGVVSVGRSGRPFTASDRELFNYLAGQAARSMENVDLHETAARESVTDDLTGLNNRRAFDDILASEIERARRFGGDLGLVLIDLDNFKVVNDTYGHPQGDLVLREVARVLRESSREIDHPARYGGEELAVVLPGTDLEGAFNRAERIRDEIERLEIPRLDGGGTVSITTSSASPRCTPKVRMDGRWYRPPTTRCTRPSTAGRTRPSARGRLSFGMGLLDDAIKEHLELKRRRGADAVEISRLESEALGPVRRSRTASRTCPTRSCLPRSPPARPGRRRRRRRKDEHTALHGALPRRPRTAAAARGYEPPPVIPAREPEPPPVAPKRGAAYESPPGARHAAADPARPG